MAQDVGVFIPLVFLEYLVDPIVVPNIGVGEDIAELAFTVSVVVVRVD